jgi:hypothetical protein
MKWKFATNYFNRTQVAERKHYDLNPITEHGILLRKSEYN